MTTIRNALSGFASETAEGNRRSMSSPFMVIELFGKSLDEYGVHRKNPIQVETGLLGP